MTDFGPKAHSGTLLESTVVRQDKKELFVVTKEECLKTTSLQVAINDILQQFSFLFKGTTAIYNVFLTS